MERVERPLAEEDDGKWGLEFGGGVEGGVGEEKADRSTEVDGAGEGEAFEVESREEEMRELEE